MENDNKYYSIIEDLVKSHKKYNGHDAILTDIVEDVYKHSKSVIGAVNDEDVILSYLKKMVNVSIITVPKRLNFHSEIKHRTISTEVTANPQPIEISAESQTADTKVDIQEEEQEEKIINTPKANVEFVDRMINSIDSSSVLETNSTDIKSDDNNNNTLFEELQIPEKPVDMEPDIEEAMTEDETIDKEQLSDGNEPVDLESATEEVFTEDEPVDLESATEEAFAEDEPVDLESATEEVFAEDEPVDLESATEEVFAEDEPVDLEPATEEVFAEDEPVDLEPVTEEVFAEDEPVDLEPVTEEIFAENESVDLEPATEEIFEEDEPKSLETISEDIFTNDESETLAPAEWTNSDEIMLQEVDNNVELNILQEESSDNSLDILSFEEDSFEMQETDDIQSETFNIEEESSVNQDFDFDDNDTSVDLAEENSSNDITEFKPIDYSMFSFAPSVQNEDIDIHDIENKLVELDNQEPDLYILKVFDLKYKQDLPIAKIAEILDTDKQTVISALDKIIELI